MKINEITTIRLGRPDQTKAKAFMADFERLSQPHPLNERKRILHNVQVELSIFGNRVHINDLLTHERRQGNLGRAMAVLKQLADTHQVKLELTAHGYDGVSTDDLISIYSKLGFVADSDEPEDMVYYPK